MSRLSQIALLAVITTVGAARPAHAVLRHNYLFNGGDGTQVLDSEGTAHGEALDGVLGTTAPLVNVAESRLIINAGAADQQYANLPGPDIAINTYSEVTLEMWFLQTGPIDQFTFAAGLGRTSIGENDETAGLGYDYLMLQPTRGGGDGSRGAITTNTFDLEIGVTDGGRDLNDGGLHHIVMTVDSDELGYYVDGQQIGVASLLMDDGEGGMVPAASLADVSNDLAYLGRALYGDPYLEGSIFEFRIWDNAMTDTEVATSFTDGCWDDCGDPLRVEIDRTTGVATLMNDLSPQSVVLYEITSAAGAIDPVGWDSVTDNGDSDSGGSIDADDAWQIVGTPSNTSISETEPIDGGGDDGFQAGGPFNLGALWTQSPFEDLVMSASVLDENFNEVPVTIPIQFVGGEAISRSDFDADGDIDADDYLTLLGNHLQTLTGALAIETWPQGDVDGDLDNDFDDFRLFKNDFIAANGVAAFAALNAIPEPSSALAALSGLACLAARRRR